MPLETECRPVGPRHALEGTVEERDVRRPKVVLYRRGIDGEAMVQARDDHAAGVEILHRMVRAVVAEFHLQRLSPRCEAHELVAEANAENRQGSGVEQLAN